MENEFSVIAIKSTAAPVIEHLTRFFKANGGAILEPVKESELPSKTFLSLLKTKPVQLHDNAIRFRFHENNPWTIIQFEVTSMMPGLLYFLSTSLKTDLFAVEQIASVGYRHFSNLKSGEFQHLYTEHDGEEAELINMNYIDILEHAAANRKFDASKIGGLNEEEIRHQAFLMLTKVTPISFFNKAPWPEKSASDGYYRYLLEPHIRARIQLGNGSDNWETLQSATHPI